MQNAPLLATTADASSPADRQASPQTRIARWTRVLVAAVLSAVLISPVAQAQLSLNNAGQVSVGDTQFDPNEKVNVTFGLLSSSARVINAEYTGIGNYDAIAVRGISEANPAWGIGGLFSGGWAGAYARADQVSGSGNRIGLKAVAGYGSTTNEGLRAEAVGNTGSKTGVAGYASGAGTNYGIYGYAAGGSTNYAGFFNGDVHATGTITWASDRRFKTNVEPLSGQGVMSRLGRLRAYSYTFLDGEAARGMAFGEGTRFGLIAQEVEEVYPELVSEVTAQVPGPSVEGQRDAPLEEIQYKSVNYVELVPLLLQAVQEQQQAIDALEARLAALDGRN